MPKPVARRIVAAMRVGDTLYVRPEHIGTILKAAIDHKIWLKDTLETRKGVLVYCMVRLSASAAFNRKNLDALARSRTRRLTAKVAARF